MIRRVPLVASLLAIQGAACLGVDTTTEERGGGKPDKPPGNTPLPERVTTFVIVFDGLEKELITPEVMPTLHGLSNGVGGRATVFRNASATMVTETLPNHAGMMTGVPASEHGIVANSFSDGTTTELMRRPALMREPTLFDAVAAQRPSLKTAAVLGWVPLIDLFDCTRRDDGACGESAENPEGELVFHVRPDYLVGASTDPQTWADPGTHAIAEPLAESTHDRFMFDQMIELLEQDEPPDVFFVNLPIIDSFQHLFGPRSPEALGMARETDLEFARFVDYLRDTERWEESVLILTADHSFLALDELLVSHPVLGQVSGTRVVLSEQLAVHVAAVAEIITHAGSASVYLHDPDDAASAADIARSALAWRDVLGRPVVSAAYCRLPTSGCPGMPAEWGAFDRRLGDVLLTADDQHMFLRDRLETYAAITGHHGGPTATPIPLIVASGGDLVNNRVVDRAVSNLDVAPTVGWLYGLKGRQGRPFPGRSEWSRPLAEAF